MSEIKKPSIFELTELKVSKKKGLAIKWAHSVESAVEKNYEKLGKESDLIPHPDMVISINSLKSVIMQYYDFEDGKEDTLRIDKVTVSYHETTDNRSVQVFATRTIEFGDAIQNVPVKTPKLLINETLIWLGEIIDEINEEACLYVFDRKNSQPELAFEVIEEDSEAA